MLPHKHTWLHAVQVNRRVRVEDDYLGKMVGIGSHFSYHGVVEPFKPERMRTGSKKEGNLHQQASLIHTAKRAFDFFASAFASAPYVVQPLGCLYTYRFYIHRMLAHTQIRDVP